MKRYAVYAILLFSFILVANAAFALEIRNSKHDLSSGSTTSIKSLSGPDGTDQICVFCHTPHSARQDAPLWNRTGGSASYTLYNKAFSDVLAIVGQPGSYPDAENPSDSASAGYIQHAKTRICLSCHDGTVALGSLANLPPPLVADVVMQGPNLMVSKLTSGSAGYIGTDLSDDHPVAIQYQGGNGAALSGKDPELKMPVTGKVRLYGVSGSWASVNNANGSYVECTSCHNVHDNANGNFLIDSNSSSNICTSCHLKQAGTAAPASLAHDVSITGYNPDGAGSIGATVGGVKCMNCHYSHRAGATGAAAPFDANAGYGKYLLSFQEDNTCFNNPNRWGQPVSVCHASNTMNASGRSINIKLQIEKLPNSAHSAVRNANYSGKHGAMEQTSSSLGYGKITTHVVCSDCHNAHTAGNGPLHTMGTNAISNTSSLYGAGGVTFSGSGPWTPTTSGNFTAFEPVGATNSTSMPASYYEYQICLKCHSSFAWGAGAAPTAADLGISMTDQAKELNTQNLSYHPVMGAINTANSYPPPNVSWTNPAQFNANSVMYCSDCHGNNTAAGEAQGPHGSINKAILVTPFDDTYGSAGLAQPNTDLCFNCHAYSVYGQSGLNTPNNLGQTGFSTVTTNINLHTQHAYRSVSPTFVTLPWKYKCVNCHPRVSHGYLRRGMVVMQNDVPGVGAYEAGGANSAPILPPPSSSLPAGPGANQYGTAINSNCTIQAGVTGCHHN